VIGLLIAVYYGYSYIFSLKTLNPEQCSVLMMMIALEGAIECISILIATEDRRK